MSVYLSVAPPDGFTRWRDAEWDRWLREHPWEAAERIASRGDWAIFLYQLRQHCPKGKLGVETLLEQLVNERPISSEQAAQLQLSLEKAREEMAGKPAEAMKAIRSDFASAQDLDALIARAHNRPGAEPTLADVWAETFSQLGKVLDSAVSQKRGVYFGNV